MNTKDQVKLVADMSKYLHADDTKKWLYPVFSWVYRHARFTRPVLDKVSDIYLAIDDTYYNTGLVDKQVVIPKSMFTGTPSGSLVSSSTPSYAQAWANTSRYLPTSQEQGRTSQCTCYTTENMVAYIMRKAGLNPPANVTNRTALYSKVAYKNGDNGAVYDDLIKYVANNNVPVAFGQDYTGADNWQRILDNRDTLGHQAEFGMRFFTGKKKLVFGWESIKKAMADNPTWAVQVNIAILGDWNSYFGKKEVYKMAGNTLGGHSTMGAYVCKNRKGDSEGLLMVDGAYRPTLMEKTTDGRLTAPRYMDREVFNAGQAYIRLVETTMGAAPQPLSRYRPLATAPNMKLGSRGAMVKLLQDLLKERGHLKINQTTEYFGKSTQRALKAFIKKETGQLYNRPIFGNISRSVIKKLMV